jgi:AraC-like DNA-binding protein
MSAVHSLMSVPASTHLRQYVRAYAQRDVCWAGSDILQPVPASLENLVEFDFAGLPILDHTDGTGCESYQTALTGPNTFRRLQLRIHCSVQSFGIFFQPFGLWQLFGIPVKECTDKAYSAEDVLGKQIRELWEILAEITTFDRRVQAVERVLSGMLDKASDRTVIMDTAHHTIRLRPTSHVAQLAHSVGLSPRQYERRFIAEVGMSPKLYTRISRYQAALDIKLRNPHRAWLTIAHEAGYHDQMHMIKDFQLLSGAPPDRLLKELGDSRPPAVASEV